jgi:hypothetical protein
MSIDGMEDEMEALRDKKQEITEMIRPETHRRPYTLEKFGEIEILLPVLLDQTEPHIVISGRSLFSL